MPGAKPDRTLQSQLLEANRGGNSASYPVVHSRETVWYYPQFALNQGLCWGVHRYE